MALIPTYLQELTLFHTDIKRDRANCSYYHMKMSQDQGEPQILNTGQAPPSFSYARAPLCESWFLWDQVTEAK